MRSSGRWVLCGLLLSLTHCGGSASESPWPPEPSDVDLGPAGEQELLQGTPRTTARPNTIAEPAIPQPAASGSVKRPVAEPIDP